MGSRFLAQFLDFLWTYLAEDSRMDNPEAGYPEEFSCICLLVRDPQVTKIVQYYCIFFTVAEKQPPRQNF